MANGLAKTHSGKPSFAGDGINIAPPCRCGAGPADYSGSAGDAVSL